MHILKSLFPTPPPRAIEEVPSTYPYQGQIGPDPIPPPLYPSNWYQDTQPSFNATPQMAPLPLVNTTPTVVGDVLYDGTVVNPVPSELLYNRPRETTGPNWQNVPPPGLQTGPRIIDPYASMQTPVGYTAPSMQTVPKTLPTAAPPTAAAAADDPAKPTYSYHFDSGSAYGGFARSTNVPNPKTQMHGLGAGLVTSDAQNVFERRKLYSDFRAPQGVNPLTGNKDEIYVGPPPNSTAQMFGQYNELLFQTPADRSDNKYALGVVTNAYTGESIEVFEEAMPPPTTDRYTLDKDTLKQPQRRLEAIQGYSVRNPPPAKTEVLNEMPTVADGINVWHDQLYADRLTDMKKDYYQNREQFNNRNGILASENPMFGKEAPAGYVGYQQAYRIYPHLVPTNNLDIGNFVANKTDDTFQQNAGSNMQQAVYVRGAHVENQGNDYGCAVGPTAPGEVGVNVYRAAECTPTLMGLGESAERPWLAAGANVGDKVVYNSQTEIRSTGQKGLMDEAYPVTTSALPTLGASNEPGVIGGLWADAKSSSLKAMMSEAFPVTATAIQSNALNTGVSGAGIAAAAAGDTLRQTQKTFMEQAFQIVGLNGELAKAGVNVQQLANYTHQRSTQDSREYIQMYQGALNDYAQANGIVLTPSQVNSIQARLNLAKALMEQAYSNGSVQTLASEGARLGVDLNQMQRVLQSVKDAEISVQYPVTSFAPVNAHTDMKYQWSMQGGTVKDKPNSDLYQHSWYTGETTPANGGFAITQFQGPLHEENKSYLMENPSLSHTGGMMPSYVGQNVGPGESFSHTCRDWESLWMPAVKTQEGMGQTRWESAQFLNTRRNWSEEPGTRPAISLGGEGGAWTQPNLPRMIPAMTSGRRAGCIEENSLACGRGGVTPYGNGFPPYPSSIGAPGAQWSQGVPAF